MSGGYFNNGLRIDIKLSEFNEELDEVININKYEFSNNTLSILKKIGADAERLAKLIKQVDYLYEGDTGEDSFLEFIKTIDPSLLKENT